MTRANTRKCQECSTYKPLDDFPKTRQYHRRTCKPCFRKKRAGGSVVRCRICRVMKPCTSYDSAGRTCQSCVRKQSGYQFKQYPERQRDSQLRKHYGITLAEYNTMLEAQHGRCAICHRLPTEVGNGTRPLYVDHDHDTGIVRGLLCNNCNRMIGFAEEDTAVLLAGAAYVAAHL